MLSQMPLQTYLGMLMMSYTSSIPALQVLKRGLPKWSPELEKDAANLKKQLQEIDQKELKIELISQVNNKLKDLTAAINYLNNYQYKRDVAEPSPVWCEGSSRLFEYAVDKKDSPVVLFIPSLINRSYILDLSKERSFVRYLQKRNITSYLLDWGEPSGVEMEFSLEDYITSRLDRIIDFIMQKQQRPIFLAGYCMGGLIACASALRNSDKIKGLVMMATPWDFHVKEFARVNMGEDSVGILEKVIGSVEKVPANIIQSLFYYLHPGLVQQKFDNIFNIMNDEAKNLEEFAALEHWVNDGVAMVRKVSKECFIDWVHHNGIKEGKWQVGGNLVVPEKISVPVLFVMAKNDHIVPVESTLPLIDLVRNKTIITSDAGHVSMVAGSRAKKTVWEPFVEWVYKESVL